MNIHVPGGFVFVNGYGIDILFPDPSRLTCLVHMLYLENQKPAKCLY